MWKLDAARERTEKMVSSMTLRKRGSAAVVTMVTAYSAINSRFTVLASFMILVAPEEWL